jgi:hypothetical protein
LASYSNEAPQQMVAAMLVFIVRQRGLVLSSDAPITPASVCIAVTAVKKVLTASCRLDFCWRFVEFRSGRSTIE